MFCVMDGRDYPREEAPLAKGPAALNCSCNELPAGKRSPTAESGGLLCLFS